MMLPRQARIPGGYRSCAQAGYVESGSEHDFGSDLKYREQVERRRMVDEWMD